MSADKENMKKIPLHGKGEGKYALVDDDEYELVNKYRWHLHEFGYAITKPRINGHKPTVRMHRLIMQYPDGVFTDHINGNKLDNRKRNLRPCTHMQNTWNRSKPANNTSGYRGVRWIKKDNRWQAEIMVEHTPVFIGYFKDKHEAAYVRDQFAMQLHGEFAYTNLLRGACR